MTSVSVAESRWNMKVSRAQFMMWTKGDLLNFSRGRGIAVNEHVCEDAMEALEHGQVVELTDVKGNTVSTIRYDPEQKAYQETVVSVKN